MGPAHADQLEHATAFQQSGVLQERHMVPAGGSMEVRCVSPASYMHIGAATSAPLLALTAQSAHASHLA